MMKNLLTGLLVVLSISTVVNASVFSGQGVGIPLSSVLGTTPGRAGLGLAATDSSGPDFDQPAKFAETKDVRVSFAGSTKTRYLRNKIGNTASQGEFQFGGFAISLPLYKKWRTGLVVSPYTLVNYKSVSQESLATSSYSLYLSGNGGLTRYGIIGAYGDTDWRFGLEVGALAGSINNGWQSYFSANSGYADGWFTVNRQMIGVYARPGIILNAGNQRYSLVAQTPSRLSVIEEVRYAMTERTTHTNSTFDTPWEVKTGFASNFGDWRVGADISWAQWSAVRSNYFQIQPKDEVGGGGWVEHPGKTGLAVSYMNRIAWRGGLSYRQLPTLTANDKRISEWTGAIGLTLPTATARNYINLAGGYTIRGETSVNQLQERVIWTSISVSLAEKWFVREQPTKRRK